MITICYIVTTICLWIQGTPAFIRTSQQAVDTLIQAPAASVLVTEWVEDGGSIRYFPGEWPGFYWDKSVRMPWEDWKLPNTRIQRPPHGLLAHEILHWFQTKMCNPAPPEPYQHKWVWKWEWWIASQLGDEEWMREAWMDSQRWEQRWPGSSYGVYDWVSCVVRYENGMTVKFN